MRWYLDTEFDDNGRTIELISIALVCETDTVPHYYAVSKDFNPDTCNEWVKENVLPHLGRGPKKTRKEIKAEIQDHLLKYDMNPQFWAYFADYDWVVFCQLWGRMIDLPRFFPKYCNDIKQEMVRLGVGKDQLPKQIGTEHDALFDAAWNRQAHDWLIELGQGVRRSI